MLFEFDVTIGNGGEKYLEKILTDRQYDEMFRGRKVHVLNKSICGNGGTTGFVRWAKERRRGMLILVPNVSIVSGKEKSYRSDPDVCCVWGETDEIRQDSLVCISTYDQFPRLLTYLTQWGMEMDDDWNDTTFWGGRSVVCDEYHKLVDESSFRDICFRLTDLFRRTQNSVVLMSATPHYGYVKFLRELLEEEKEVCTWNIRYDTPYEGQTGDMVVPVVVVGRGRRTVMEKLVGGSGQTCVFLSNVGECVKMVRHLGRTDVEILCSKSSRKKCGEWYSDGFNPEKKIHFMTSAYFTGHDIDIPIGRCVVVGSPRLGCTSYSERDLKQMLGRFRRGVDSVVVLVCVGSPLREEYLRTLDRRDSVERELGEYKSRWREKPHSVRLKQELLHLSDTLERYHRWSSPEEVGEMVSGLREDGHRYIPKYLKPKDVNGKEKTKQKLSYQSAKRKLLDEGELTTTEYPYSYMLKEWIEVRGRDGLMEVSLRDLREWYKVHDKTSDVDDLSLLTPSELSDVLGLQDFGVYRGSYLRQCLRSVGVNIKDYQELPRRTYETLGISLVLEKSMGSGRERNNEYLVLRRTMDISHVSNCQFGNVFLLPSSIENVKKYVTKLAILDKPLSVEVENHPHCYGVTTTLRQLIPQMKRLTGNSLYQYVMEDKPTRLPQVKNEKRWKNLKLFQQNKISEFYLPTDQPSTRYRMIKSQMTHIHHLIVDIDGGIPYSRFKEIYSSLIYISYPTLSNITEDWTKYRVIFPLSHPLTITGDDNLRIVKTLRTMVCPFEDPNHQLPSFVNQEDLRLGDINYQGQPLTISQKTVDDIRIHLQNSKNYVSIPFTFPKKVMSSELSGYEVTKEVTDPNNLITSKPGTQNFRYGNWTLEQSKSYFQNSFSLGDGGRYKSLFVIKNRLSVDDLTPFEDWLGREYPTYLGKWRGHKKIKN